MRKIFGIRSEIAVILVVAGIIAIGGAVYGFYQFNKKPKKVSELKTSYSLSSDELFDAFDQNESEATEKYAGKVIEVNGKITEKDINKEGKQNFVIKAQNAMIGGVNAAMEDKLDKNYNIGDNIKLKCMCVGFNMEVILNNCIVSNEK